MALVKCPKCQKLIKQNRSVCSLCGNDTRGKTPAIEPPRTTIELERKSAPTSAHARWYYVFGASLIVFAFVYGSHAGGLLGLIGGAVIALCLGLVAFPTSLGVCWLIYSFTGHERDELIPVVATLIMALVTISVAINGVGGGDPDCTESGRYGEYSSC